MNADNPRDDPRFPIAVEQTEARSWIDLAERNPDSFECHYLEGMVLFVDNQTPSIQNRVMLMGLTRQVRPQTIEAIIKTFQDAGKSRFIIRLSPTARPTSLPRMLDRYGFKRGEQEAVLARSPVGVEAPDSYFRIRVAEPGDAEAVVDILRRAGDVSEVWARSIAINLDSPRWRFYLAYDGGTPYAYGGVFLDGEICWMAPTYTLPEYRNRGTQSAMVAHVLRESLQYGCKWMITYYPVTRSRQARNYTRLGFELVYMRPTFVWTATES